MIRRLTLLALFILPVALCVVAAAQSDKAEQQRQERLAKHAELFKEYDNRLPLEKRKPNAKGEIDLSVAITYDIPVSLQPFVAEKLYSDWAHLAQTVVEGTAEQRLSALTPRRSFVYSDWEIRVCRVFKNVSSIPVTPRDLITVVQPGGRLTINGRTVFAHLADLPEYTLNERYVLYLQALPDSPSFRPVVGGFELGPLATQCLIEPGNPDPQLRTFCKGLSHGGVMAAVERSVAK